MTDPKPCDRCGQPHAKCIAHTRAGNPCQQRRMDNQLVCRMHGGKSPRALAAAEGRRVEAEATELVGKLWNLDATPIKDPVTALQSLAGQMRHALDHLGQRLDVGDTCPTCGVAPLDLGSAEGIAWTRVMRELRQGLEGMGRLGVAERVAQVEAAKVRLIAVALGRGLDAVELTNAQRETILRATFAALREATSPDGDPMLDDPPALTAGG